jgi:DNA-binding NtrC family response regulator
MDMMMRGFGAGTAAMIGVPWMILVAAPILIILSLLVAIPFYLLSEQAFKRNRIVAGTIKALVVDDDESSILSLLSILSDKKVEVDLAENAEVMRKKLSERDYDLIFVDRMMPDQAGDVALAVADDALTGKKLVPVIFFTGSDTPFHVPPLYHFYIQGVWGKQVAYQDLNDQVDQLLHTLDSKVA